MHKALALFAVIISASACQHGHHHAPSDAPLLTSGVLTEAAVAIPIAPGKTADWQAALEELTGPRYAEYETSRRRFGLTSQTTFVQKTPMGDFALIHLTGADVHASFHAMATSQDPWDVKWRALTMNLHGVDFAQGERVMPTVVPLYATGADTGEPAAQAYMFLAPVGPGGADTLRTVARELAGPRHAEYVRARAAIGVRREAVFFESTAHGDAIVVFWRSDDPVASLHRLAASTDPFDRWLRDQIGAVHPIGLDAIVGIASANALVASYPH
jgi:hypothetical protein